MFVTGPEDVLPELRYAAVPFPLNLTGYSLSAALDEVHHAEACFAIAAALGGPVGPGPLSCDDLLAAPELSPEAVLRGTFDEGCVGETVAAALARAGAESASDPEIARVLHRIADDETRHAALALLSQSVSPSTGILPLIPAYIAPSLPCPRNPV